MTSRTRTHSTGGRAGAGVQGPLAPLRGGARVPHTRTTEVSRMRSVVGNVAGLALVFASLAVGVRWLTTGRPPRVLRPVVDRAEAFVAARRPRPEPIPPVLLALELGRL